MRNVCFISGLAREIGTRSGYVLQTRNDNLKIPFVVDGNGTIPSWVREGEPVKIVGRLTGAVLKAKNGDELKEQHRVAVVKVLSFERPTILEMPAQECWEMSVARGAPTAPVTAKSYGLPHSKSSNTVQVAGFVSGVIFRKAGVPDAEGRRKGACLLVLIRQTKNPDEAIPVRVYGDKVTKEYERTLRLGTPVVITQGDLRVDVKETGGGEVEGVAEVSKMPYIRSYGLHVATRDHIQHQPDWAVQLAKQGREKKANSEAPANPGQLSAEVPKRPALQIGTAADGGEGEAGAGNDDLSMDDADVAAVMAQVGVLPKPAVKAVG